MSELREPGPEPTTPLLIPRARLELTGLDGRAIRRLTRSGTLRRVRKGHYTEAQALVDADERARHLLEVQAALARLEGSCAVSCESAAVLHGAYVMDMPTRVHVTREKRCYAKYPGVVTYAARLPEHHRDVLDDAPVTTGARTAIDVARHRMLPGALVTLDSLLRIEACTVDELQAVLLDCGGWPGVRRAAAAVTHVDPKAETPLESISRAAMIMCGVPMPLTQQWIAGADGIDYRVDFLWPDHRLIGEADGKIKYTDPNNPDALWQEKRRQEALEAAGYRFVRWDYATARYQPAVLAARISAKLRVIN